MIAVSERGEQRLAQQMFGLAPVEALIVRLFVNDMTPTRTSTPASFDEMDDHGYKPQVVPPTDWRVERDKLGRTFLEAVAVMWTFEAGDPIRLFGYYVTTESGEYLWGERFRYPIEAHLQGERLRIIPRVRTRASK